ncbi:MAG: peptide-N-glycosidase F-related protein [Bacteroidota bacterium]
MNRYSFLLSALFVFVAGKIDAAPLDTVHVVSHSKVNVVTDPSKGINEYKSWCVFPQGRTRRVILHVTFQCPEGKKCGEWDYIDQVFLRRCGGKGKTSKDFEIARLVTPYGSAFKPDWKFSWDVDVTDFSSLLRDSVEVGYVHSGYEDNKDRGWIVTVDFEVIKGMPVRPPISIEKIYEGTYVYGDATKNIEEGLKAFTFKPVANARSARLRIIQTGHGMDTCSNCSEFCPKNREIFYDGKSIEKKQIWKQCGTNPLSPQAGTWLFDRAGWCPGGMVEPDNYDFILNGAASHILDVNMEPYSCSKPGANYCIYAYVIQYATGGSAFDATIEKIMIPGKDDNYSNENPACSGPKIRVRNNGEQPLLRVTVNYGTVGFPLQKQIWKGSLPFNQSVDITLNGPIQYKKGKNQFYVKLTEPTGTADEYIKDNCLTVPFDAPPEMKKTMIFYFRTNKKPQQNEWKLTDSKGKIIKQRSFTSMKAETEYRDTLRLTPGCYQLVVSDTANDGLEFWYNNEAGRGVARLMDTTGVLLKNFESDFGSGLQFSFNVPENETKNDVLLNDPIVGVFPLRTTGKTTMDYFNNIAQDVTVQITTEDGKLIQEKKYEKLKEGVYTYDLSGQALGRYYIKVTAGDKTVSKRIRIIEPEK